MEYELREILLSDDIDAIYSYLDNNYKYTLNVIYDVIMDCIREKNNYEYIGIILNNLEEIIKIEEKKSNLKLINNMVRRINSSIGKIKLTDRDPSLKNIRFKIIDLNRQIVTKKENKKISELGKMIEYLIFEEKNLSIVEKLIEDEKQILLLVNEDGFLFFDLLLDKYVNIKEKDKDKDYYYQVIKLFIRKMNITEKDRYIKNLNKIFKNINTVQTRNIIELFKEDSINYEFLENKYDIRFEPSKRVLDEISKLEFLIDKRMNFTAYNAFTIDNNDSLCLDDALYLKINSDGTYTIFNFIMDIPSLIPYNSETNYEAYKKFETIYLPDNIINVYPEFVCNDRCSLLPNKDKYVFAYIVDVDSNYDILYDTFRINKAIINVKNRLTYKDADKIIANPSNNNLDMQLEKLAMISLKLKESNKNRRKYRDIENVVNLNKKHHSNYPDSISNTIIQEMAVLTNYMVPSFMLKNNYPYYFRNHIQVEDKFILDILNNFDIYLDRKDSNKYKNIIKMGYLNANYSSVNLGHNGLGLDVYSHSTAPGRRYSDASGQYIIDDIYINNNNSDSNLYYWEDIIKENIQYFNERQEKNRQFFNEYCFLMNKKLIRKK